MDFRRPALAFFFLSLGCSAGCGTNRGRAAHPSPAATATTATPAATATIAPTLRDANRAESDGRAGEALALYESIAVTRPAGPERLQALMCAARLRLSANPALRDLTKARAHLADVSGVNPKQPATIPAADLMALLDDAASLASLRDQQDQRASALRGENRTLRTTIKALQEELAKKDEALHRATEKLLDKAPPPH
jgi:hypothetical protein